MLGLVVSESGKKSEKIEKAQKSEKLVKIVIVGREKGEKCEGLQKESVKVFVKRADPS